MTVDHIACSAQEILLAADGPQILLLIHFQVQIQAQIQVQVLIQVQTRVQVLMMKSLLCSPLNTQIIKKVFFAKCIASINYLYRDFR